MRATRQRAAIIALLDTVDEFRSAQELRRTPAPRREHRADDVYRTLQSLSAADLVDMVRTDTGESVYRRCAADDHHHHLVCRGCGSAVEVSGREVEAWAAEVAQAHGFSEVSHTIELFGICADCRRG